MDDNDYSCFLSLLGTLTKRAACQIHAFCLMPNHFHFLVQTPCAPLHLLMHDLLGSYARYFNQRWNRSGHLFYERYKALLCKDNNYLTTLTRYIHRNPVKAGLAVSPASWPWSSYGDYLNPSTGSLATTGLVLAVFGGIEPLREFTEREICAEHDRYDPAVVEQVVTTRPALQDLLSDSDTRWKFVGAALAVGYKSKEIANFLDCTPQNVTNLRRRLREGLLLSQAPK